MHSNKLPKGLTVAALAAVLVWGVMQTPVLATHAWGPYHWARTSNPFTVKLIRHLTAAWRPSFDLSAQAWNTVSVLNTQKVNSLSDATTRANCPVVNGRVAVCNYTYGATGWLGLAQIWIDGNSHIYQGRTLLNDSYSSYWTGAEGFAYRQFVMCQEIGHTFGLGHQDENFYNANLGTCMDYTASPLTPPNNLALNAHDHAQLGAIYAHTDGYTTLTEGGASMDVSEFNSESAWGEQVDEDVYVRELGGGFKVLTHVFRPF